MVKKKKIGLSLGSGGARGLAHIGVLKVLHKHKIYPDYIAGTSMGAVVGAVYSSGHTPKDMERIAKTADWKSFADFTVPKQGLLRGLVAERRIRSFVSGKKFKDLDIPLKVVAFNIDKKEEVIFNEGDVAKAVRASMSIPGIFDPIIIDNETYIDGAVANPTPFDVAREMGADIVIAVDLYNTEKTVTGPLVRQETILTEIREKFVAIELLNIKNYVIPKRWPGFIKKIISWTFDKLLYPARILNIMAGREMPPITKVMYNVLETLINNLAKERFKCGIIDIKVRPKFKDIGWPDFQNVDKIIRIGEKAMERQMPQLKKRLRVK